MGSKNSKGLSQETIDMLKNSNFSQFDLMRLMSGANGSMPMQNAYQQNLGGGGGGGGGAYPISSAMNAMGGPYSPMHPQPPQKPPRQLGEHNIVMTGGLAGSRMSIMGRSDFATKGYRLLITLI